MTFAHAALLMPVRVSIDEQSLDAEPGASLFECAEQMGVRVPTSCNKNGKCRECLVDVTEGMTHLSSLTEEEQHLQGGYRLACRARVLHGQVTCRTLSRGSLVTLESAADLHDFRGRIPLDSQVRP